MLLNILTILRHWELHLTFINNVKPLIPIDIIEKRRFTNCNKPVASFRKLGA